MRIVSMRSGKSSSFRKIRRRLSLRLRQTRPMGRPLGRTTTGRAGTEIIGQMALGFTSARANRHHHSVNISDGHRHPATDCSDLRIRFDDRDAVVRSEERTLTKAEAAVLQVRPHRNGGVQVVGWDKETYSVTACKAAAGSGDAAERILSQITMSVEHGKVSTKGPGDEEDWTVYLLVRTPK